MTPAGIFLHNVLTSCRLFLLPQSSKTDALPIHPSEKGEIRDTFLPDKKDCQNNEEVKRHTILLCRDWQQFSMGYLLILPSPRTKIFQH
jgi:hypothetical protein